MSKSESNQPTPEAPQEGEVSVSQARQAYTQVVDKLTTIFREGQASAIQSMWRMGQVVQDFMAEAEKSSGSRYGSFSIDNLSEDLKGRDVNLHGRSTLYHCRNVYKSLSYEQIGALAKRGYTTNHVKALLPLSAELRERVHAEMIDPRTNEIIPEEVLRSKIRDLQGVSDKEKADDAIQGKTVPQPTEAEVIEASVDNGYTGEDGKAVETEGNAPLETPAPGEAPVKATAAPDYSKPPLPGVKKLTKTLAASLGNISDAVIALREVPKVGFDSKIAATNWIQARDDLKTTAADVRRYLDEVIKIADESAANDGLAEFTAPTSDDFKRKRRRK